MKNKARITILKRTGIRLLQHFLAALILMAAAGLLLNSYVEVESIDGPQVYKIFPFESDQEFEESEIFHDLFRNAVSDITQLVMIKRQLETDGVFVSTKRIDVTEYAAQVSEDAQCPLTVVYELDDLIKWGKYGVEYTTRMMSMSEFINYFGDVICVENFGLDEAGNLCFVGFNKVVREEEKQEDAASDPEAESGTAGTEEQSAEHDEQLLKEFEACSREQLEDKVYSYIMGQGIDDIISSREDDARITITLPLLNCRYETVNGEKQLLACADNWLDYMRLQDNVAVSIEQLTLNYQRYQVCNDAYKEGNSNIKYMVRMMTDEGMCTYTNVSDLEEEEDTAVTEFFSEYRRYLIYYPDSLVFMGNTVLSEEEIDDYISVYDYAYPDTTHIWLGIDTGYEVQEDAFYNAGMVYNRIVPNVGKVLAGIIILAVFWMAICIYLTTVTGVFVNEEGERIGFLNRFDRLWTEISLLLALGLIYLGYLGYQTLRGMCGTEGVIPSEIWGIQLTRLYRYGVFAAYGVYVSVSFSLIWYSLVRRVRCGNLWSDSLLHRFCVGVRNTVVYVFRHKNSVISTLIPYNLFLFANLIGGIAVYSFRGERFLAGLILAGIVLFDGIVGVLLFKRGAEQVEIVEGISRIRDGEVEFKLATDNLHGANREMADAVNNIGEGIRKAVRTSMKDEQMKTDLITNVSHDIKTPLTSIINYVDLLKRLKIEQEPAKSYIGILDNKAQRLKQLTDDLVEASKISSGNIELNKEKLNLTELINQSLGEFSEKLEEQNLQVVFENNNEPAFIYADSRRMWRVVENLFNNICKYAMEGTRVYVDMFMEDGKTGVSFKNISKQQMNIRPEELTERFIRGDSSRSTEGSGLGLSIAQSLVQVQGGSFQIYLDGDLFKIVIEFAAYVEE
ncbi:MAG: HAMP domain-containing histidine kinase [Lachnospiraceae bacterium]|nr:HAMP domain-containing histidine kinase [Lachnospiraceae bacterium]MCM1239718.1 HAMP domain-containing histidine kinase [Lachnospiraceae bacterium]